ncbi:MAG: hypothetical protein ACRD96_00580 [Bryobacteraceae bacterium]
MRFFGIATVMALVLTLLSPQPILAIADSNDQRVVSQSEDNSAREVAANGQKKPWYKSRALKYSAGSAGAGAIVGGLIGGGKGAAAGAAVGGGAGYLYHRKTRRK